MSAVVDLLLQLRDEGHRALVFSQFVEHLALVKEALVQAHVDHLYLDGLTSEKLRMERVEAFQRGEGDAFLISLKAGGTGLNLTGADYVLHLDPWWTRRSKIKQPTAPIASGRPDRSPPIDWSPRAQSRKPSSLCTPRSGS